MSSLGGSCSFGKRARSRLHGLHRLVDGQRGLRQPDHLVLVAHRHSVDGARTVDQLYVVGGFAGSADDLLVALVADQQDVVVVAGESLGLVVHLGDQRAGGVDDPQPSLGGRRVHGRGHAVGGEHHDGSFGHLVGLLDEHRTGLGQRFDHVAVVHDLMPDVDGCAVFLQRTFDGLDGTIDAGAVPTGLGKQDTLAGHRLRNRGGGAHGIPMFTVGGMSTSVLSADTGPPTRAQLGVVRQLRQA